MANTAIAREVRLPELNDIPRPGATPKYDGTTERAQGWLRLPNGEALCGFSHGCKRHGTITLFAALEVATGLVHIGHYHRRRRREFLDFMNRIVALYPNQELHVILNGPGGITCWPA